MYAFDVPGVPEDKIAVEIEDNTLTVSGSRERAEAVEDERFFRYERRFGDFTRSVALPQGCGEGEAQAHYANGALEVHVKKPEQSKPRRVPVMTTCLRRLYRLARTDPQFSRLCAGERGFSNGGRHLQEQVATAAIPKKGGAHEKPTGGQGRTIPPRPPDRCGPQRPPSATPT